MIFKFIDKKSIDIIFNDVNLHKYPDYIVYQLFDGEKMIHKGIIHDDVDNKIATVILDKNERKKYRLVLDTVNRKKGSIALDGKLLLNDKQIKKVSYIDRYYESYKVDMNQHIKDLANEEKVEMFDKDKNIKSIKIAKTMDERYLKDE